MSYCPLALAGLNMTLNWYANPKITKEHAVLLKALVVDDSGMMRKMVIKSITEAKLADFEFVEAADGKEALAAMTTTAFDIAFVDWNMPNMTGIEFVKEVRALERRNDGDPISLVMVTSEKTIGKLQEALDEGGADQFVSKPFTVEEIKVKLKKSVDKAQFVAMRRRRKQQNAAQPQPKAKEGFFGSLFG